MNKLKNRPENYVKRSDLPGRSSYAKKAKGSSANKPKARDFSTVEIDSNFYFTFRRGADQRNR
jgi:hypothetical protein